MTKKFLSIILVGLMIFSLLPTTFAQDVSVDEIYNEFAEYFVKETSFSSITQSTGSSGYNNVSSVTTDLPFVAKTYFKNIDSEGNTITPAKDTPVIFYVINHGEEVIGTESNISIVNDMLDDGYIVFTLDYLNNPKAVSPEIDWSLLGARTQIMAKIKDYFPQISYTYAHQEDYAYIVPEGCRIERNIWYFNLIENGSVLTEQMILESWNSDGFKNKAPKIPAVAQNNYQKGVWYEAETLEDCVRPDGSPIDLDLRLDIIYPSQPKSKPPVFALASSSEMRNGSTGHASRPHFIGFLMRGYAGACYDHEYIPMARTDHYGYYSMYTTAKINGVKTHTAAIRCIRQYADDFGYDGERIGVWGHSKSSYSALLGRENPELLPEIAPAEVNGPQPNLTYNHNGETIPSNVQCVYTSMGDGTKRHATLVNKTTAPSIPACGQKDQYGAYTYWSSMLETYKNNDIVTLAMDMPDLGHEYPYAIDPILNYDRYSATLDFFDYHLKGNIGAKAVYAYPKDGNQEISISDSVYVKFNAPISKEEIEKNVKIIDASSGKSISGSWSSLYGGTQWTFTTDLFENAHVYNLVVPTTIKGDNGLNLSEGWFTKFVTKGSEKLFPSKDAYIDSASLINTGSQKTIEISAGSKKGYIEFDLSKLQSGSLTSSLQFNVENKATQNLLIYGLKDNAPLWEENTINWDNAPANVEGNLFDEEYATLIDRILVKSSGIFTIDVTSYIDSLSGDKARFVISSVSKPDEETLNIQFDNLTSTGRNTETTIVNECHSDKYLFRADSSSTKLSLSTEYDVNGNGKSLFFDRNNKYDRIIFYNMLKTSALTEDDIGKTFESSVWVYPLADMKIQVGLMNHSEKLSNGSRLYSYTQKDITAGSWHEIKFTCAIDENVVNEQIGMLCIRTNGGVDDFYIDNIVVKEIATDVTITSKEGRDSENQKFMPTLILEKGDKITSTSNDATYIKNGDDKDTIFNGGAKLYINGGETPSILSGNKKGYIKIDVSDAESTIDKAELVINVTSEGSQEINIYGIDAGENTDAHAWNETTINWYNAVGNDRHDFEVDKTYMYGGAPIATLNIGGAGKHTVDITNYAKAMNDAGNDYATIVITADTKTINYTFDDMTDFVYETDFMTGGNQNKKNIYLSSDKNYPEGTSGKSLVQKTTSSSSRVKFYNAIIPGSKGENAFTQADLGRKFKVTGQVYAEGEDTTFSVLLMGDIDTTNAQKGTQSHSVTAKANTWTSLGNDIIFEVTQSVIDGQYTLLSFQRSATGADVVYIDNLVVWELEKADTEIESLDSTYKEVLGYSNSFDDSTIVSGKTTTAEYSSTEVFRADGGSATGGTSEHSTEYDHTYGDTAKSGSMHITYSLEYDNMTKKGLERFKLYNTVENNRSLTSADVGRKFRVKFWAKGSVDGIKMKVGHMSISGTRFVKSKIVTTTSQWAQYMYEFEITEAMATASATEQGTMLTFERSTTNFVNAIAHKVGSVYIDDVEVYEIVEQQNTNPPCVVYTIGEDTSTVNAVADSFVQSGDSMFENAGYNAKIAVGNNAQVAQTLTDVKNTYLKFASDNFANANKAELKFTVKDDATQKVNIYGISNASWTQNELNWNNSPSVLGATFVSTVDITDKGEYTVDVLNFVKESTDGDITFVLEALVKEGMKVVNFNFDNAINFVKDADYMLSDSNAIENISITNTEYYEGSGSLHIVDVKNSAENVKLLNIFKNSNFTSDDIGKKYKVSGVIKASTKGRTYANSTYTDYDSIESTKVRMGIASSSSDNIVTGTSAEFTVLSGQWQPFSFDVTISEAFVNANGSALLIDQINAPNGIFATSLYIDNLVVQETSDGFGTEVIIDNLDNAPTLYTEIVSEIEYADMASSSILQKTPVSSGDFKEGDTIELRAEIKAPLEKIVKNVTFYNGDKEIVGKVYKDGYDYVIRMYNVEKGTYNVSALVKFEDGSIETTNEITFTVKAGASYVVENTSYEGNITNGSTLKVTKTVRNNTASPKTAILVLATYDDSDNLITSAISTSEVTISNGEAKDITASITMPQAGKYTVKAFIWDSYKNALPLVNPVTITDLN